MRKLSFLVAIVLLIAYSCQNSDSTIQTDNEISLQDSLNLALQIPQSTKTLPELKSTGENKALAATAFAQSTFPNYSPSNVNDSSTNVSVGGAYSWTNGHTYQTDGKLPQWFDLRFDTTITFSKINIYTTDNYEIKKFMIMVNTQNGWDTISAVDTNTSTLVTFNYDTISTDIIRVLCQRGPDKQYVYTRLNEIEVY